MSFIIANDEVEIVFGKIPVYRQHIEFSYQDYYLVKILVNLISEL